MVLERSELSLISTEDLHRQIERLRFVLHIEKYGDPKTRKGNEELLALLQEEVESRS